jgi:hypothetical protein
VSALCAGGNRAGFHRIVDVVAGIQTRFEVLLLDAVQRARGFRRKGGGTELSSRMPASPITSPGPMRPDSKGVPWRLKVTVTTPDSMMNK